MIKMIVGQTYFKNTDFIYYGINNGLVSTNNIEYLYAHPPKLGEMLLSKEMDIAPVSSIIYGQHYKDFVILPDFSISALGDTKSILVFSENCNSLDDLEGKRIAVPGTSASSSVLVEIILKSKGISTDIIYHEAPDLDSMLKEADAALLIGDHALVACHNKNKVIADLGEEWKALTGKKMVYALWVIRKKFAEENEKLIQGFYNALRKSKEYAYENIDTISKSLAEKIKISQNLMKEHLLKLDYSLDRDCEDGLKEYFDYAHRYGILKKKPQINYFKV